MAKRTYISWPVCEVAGCTGIQLDVSELCLAHASGPERDAALNQVSETGMIDARGVQISGQLLEQIIASTPSGKNGKALFKAPRFDLAIFDDAAWFDKVEFDGKASFRAATFSGYAHFGGATFAGDTDFGEATFASAAWFDEATFGGDAGFGWATFSDVAWFNGATFGGDASFSGATFAGHALFGRATFTGDAHFGGATFAGDAGFNRATFCHYAVFSSATFSSNAAFGGVSFSGNARFNEATFGGDAEFGGTTFGGDAGFGEVTFYRRSEFLGAKFEQARRFGPVLAYRGLDLDSTEFTQPIQIEVSATGICCREARFPGGVQFRLRWARVVLDDADFPAPSTLTGIPGLSSEKLAAQEGRVVKAWQRLLRDEISERPQLLSLMRANVACLGLSNVTVADCRFAGAHNLDKMRLEGDVSFALAPSPLGRLSWEGRQVIAEERDWRVGHSHRWGWQAPSWPDWLGGRPRVLDASQVAGLYRALRKGREDVKDEPGAADFYYGEMEMRRRARHTTGSTTGAASRGRAERGIVTAYWLVSGYGLRAWRALACLAAITALFAVAFHLVGFALPPQPASFWTSLLYAFRATLSLTDSDVKLTAWGQLLQGLLRLTGPVLLGLALLALRGRVRR